MHRLTLSDYLFTVVIILVFVFALSYGFRQWLLSVSAETSSRMGEASRGY